MAHRRVRLLSFLQAGLLLSGCAPKVTPYDPCPSVAGVLTSDNFSAAPSAGGTTDCGGGGRKMSWALVVGAWSSIDSAIFASGTGSFLSTNGTIASLDTGHASCTLKFTISQHPTLQTQVAALFRWDGSSDTNNFWMFLYDTNGILAKSYQLWSMENGIWTNVHSSAAAPDVSRPAEVEITYASDITVSVNGSELTDLRISDSTTLKNNTRFAFAVFDQDLTGGGSRLKNLVIKDCR